ncbi:MAG: hypothetical protein KIT11_03270 [Fimbriimonadaceae bacterium]|nr:hypothetical protein [Fimbriimonadaceae bacterium]QYK57082.1 MAG: hypothetical protein KF733_06255 [Fimbriimonadaceae bacterium]
METVLLWVVVVLLALLMLVVGAAMRMVNELKSSVKGLEKRLDGLQSDMKSIETRLAAVQAAQARRGEEPFAAAFEAFKKYRSRGWLATLVAVGSRLVGSYLHQKKAAPALPAPKS